MQLQKVNRLCHVTAVSIWPFFHAIWFSLYDFQNLCAAPLNYIIWYWKFTHRNFSTLLNKYHWNLHCWYYTLDFIQHFSLKFFLSNALPFIAQKWTHEPYLTFCMVICTCSTHNVSEFHPKNVVDQNASADGENFVENWYLSSLWLYGNFKFATISHNELLRLY